MLTSSGSEWGLRGTPPLLPTVHCCAQQSWHRLHLNAVQLQSSWRQRETRWCHRSWGALVSWEPITACAERLNPGVPAKEGTHSHRLGALPPEELEKGRAGAAGCISCDCTVSEEQIQEGNPQKHTPSPSHQRRNPAHELPWLLLCHQCVICLSYKQYLGYRETWGGGGLIEFDLYSHLWDKRTSKESAHLVASSVDSLLKERKGQITDNPWLLVPSRAAWQGHQRRLEFSPNFGYLQCRGLQVSKSPWVPFRVSREMPWDSQGSLHLLFR